MLIERAEIATHEKDLLVVCASGMGPWEGSWLSPLYRGIDPQKSLWRTPESYPQLKTEGWITVLDFPPDGDDDISVRPGVHRT